LGRRPTKLGKYVSVSPLSLPRCIGTLSLTIYQL
jgi:hypothetical protein